MIGRHAFTLRQFAGVFHFEPDLAGCGWTRQVFNRDGRMEHEMRVLNYVIDSYLNDVLERGADNLYIGR